MKRGEQMRLFDFDDSPKNADAGDQQGRGPSVETATQSADTATPSDVRLDQCTGPLFCSRCGMPYDWASGGEFCVCGARRCRSCGDA